jgi:hypothetical protein
MTVTVPLIVINLALVFCTIGVWSERLSGQLTRETYYGRVHTTAQRSYRK